MAKNDFSRHNHRIIALQILYNLDVREEFNKENIDKEIEKLNNNKDAVYLDSSSGYFKQLIEGVIDNKETLDNDIDKLAINWDIERINILDKNILRISLFEIKKDVPIGAAINEAVELAKEFNNIKSARFINGILGESVKSKSTKTDK